MDAVGKAHTAWYSNELCPLQDFLAERLLLDDIVTVVDAKHIEQHLDDKKPEGAENEVRLTIKLVSQKVRRHKEVSLPEKLRCACATIVCIFTAAYGSKYSCWEVYETRETRIASLSHHQLDHSCITCA